MANPNDAGLDALDQDGDGQWTMSDAGEAGDDLHVEGSAFCATGYATASTRRARTASCWTPMTSPPATPSGSFGTCPPSGVTYHDTDNNGALDDGEDIVLDANGNLVFD